MTYAESCLELECWVSWKEGYKPEKALQYMSTMLGYKPTMVQYKEVSRKVILSYLRNLNKKE